MSAKKTSPSPSYGQTSKGSMCPELETFTVYIKKTPKMNLIIQDIGCLCL